MQQLRDHKGGAAII